MFKKIISAIVAVAMVAAMSTTVFASENSADPIPSDTGTTTSAPVTEDEANVGNSFGTFTIDLSETSRAQLSTEQQQRVDEQLNKLFAGEINSLQVGDRIELGELGGDKLYLEVFEEPETVKNARGFNDTTSRTFHITYSDFWGNTKTAIEVAMTCYWYHDGMNSYINRLTGNYTVKNNSYSCQWDTDKGSVTNPLYFEMYLKAYHDGMSASFTFFAMCNGMADPATVTLGSL